MRGSFPFIGAIIALLLSACATTTPVRDEAQHDAQARWANRRAALEQVHQFTLQGRIASAGAFGLSGSLRWTQREDDSFEMTLAGPFGAGAVALRGTPSSVEISTRDGSAATTDPEGWMRSELGYTFPVAGLRWWALGLPSPYTAAQIDLDARGGLLALRQDGWELRYLEYQEVSGLPLPRRFEALNEQAQIKVVIDRWTDLPVLP